MKNYLIISFLFIGSIAFGQIDNSLTVVYNLFENQINYYKDGVEVLNPEVKTGDNIYVQITEFNPYIHEAELEVSHIDYNQSSQDLGSSLPGMGFQGGGFSGVSGLLGGLTMGTDIQETLSFGASRGESSADALKLKNDFYDLSDKLVEVEDNINTAYEKIQMIESQSTAQNLAIADIDELKRNQLIKPSRLKVLIEEEIRFAFAKSEGEAIEIEDLLQGQDQAQIMQEAIGSYENAITDYRSIQGKWLGLSMHPYLLTSNDPHLQLIKESADSIQNNIKSNLNKYKKIELPNDIDQEFKSTNNLMSIRRTYEELQNDIFIHKFAPLQASGDLVELNITIRQKESDGSSTLLKSVEHGIEVSGDWKISGGLGLAFGRMHNQVYSYNINDGNITRTKQDDFIPMFASFVHGYKRTTKQVAIGASFGAGFPLQGQGGVQSLSFFLGPTVILGKKEKFLVSLGVMGAKAQRLGAGLQVGDQFDSISNTLPLTTNYELGYFLSISYDLISK